MNEGNAHNEQNWAKLKKKNIVSRAVCDIAFLRLLNKRVLYLFISYPISNKACFLNKTQPNPLLICFDCGHPFNRNKIMHLIYQLFSHVIIEAAYE